MLNQKNKFIDEMEAKIQSLEDQLSKSEVQKKALQEQLQRKEKELRMIQEGFKSDLGKLEEFYQDQNQELN